MRLSLLILAFVTLTAHAAQPRLVTLKVSWDPYPVQPGYSNLVLVLYKQTSLGTVWTPWKPTAYFPASRTNGTISALPGLYHFRATIQGQPLAESAPSNTVTNRVNP